MSQDLIEYYAGRDLVARVVSAMVPPVGSAISIRKKVWIVTSVTYALDHADGMSSEKVMRANVDLKEG